MWSEWMNRVLEAQHLAEFEEELEGVRPDPVAPKRAPMLVCLAPTAPVGRAASRPGQPGAECICA